MEKMNETTNSEEKLIQELQEQIARLSKTQYPGYCPRIEKTVFARTVFRKTSEK